MIAATAEQTEACGERLARALPRSLPQMLQIQLHGDLGAGKTTLARGFLQALGHAGVVRSPTYTLVESYAVGGVTVVHTDLYRLHDPGELEALGLRDLALKDHIWLVEWPERAGGRLPEADIDITLVAHPGFHSIDLEAASAAGVQWLARLQG